MIYKFTSSKVQTKQGTMTDVKKSVKKRGPKHDLIWEHFTKISETESSCNHCSISVKEIKRIRKKRIHILKNHRDKISQDHEDDLKKENKIKVNNFNSRKKPVGIMNDKRYMRSSPVFEYFSSDPDNPAKCVCNLCQTSIVYSYKSSKASSSSMKYHLQAHHNLFQDSVKKHVCSKCGKSFRKISLKLLCEDTHNNIFKHICSQCGKGSNHKALLDRHVRSHYRATLQCTDCEKRFREKYQLKTHFGTCHKVIDYRGDLKPISENIRNIREFSNMNKVTENSDDDDDNGDDMEQCQKCRKYFQNHASLQKHQSIKCLPYATFRFPTVI